MQSRFQSDKKSTASSLEKFGNKRQTKNLNLDQNDLSIHERKLISPSQSKTSLNLITNLRQVRKDMSVSPRRVEILQYNDKSETISVGPSNDSTKQEDSVSRYECIASITEQQNKNLKEQNIYLVQKLRKMQERQLKMRKLYQKAKKYKGLWQQAKMEIQMLKDECQIYKEQAEQMKKIILNDFCSLKKKIFETQIQEQTSFFQQEYQMQSKTSQINSQASTEHKSARVSSFLSLKMVLHPQQI